MACQTTQTFRPCSRCEQVLNFPFTLDYEAVEACDLLVKMFWRLLSDLRLLSKSKILSSKELGTPAVGSQEPGYLQFRSHCLRLDAYHVAGDNVPALPVLFNPLEKLVFSLGPLTRFAAVAAFVLRHAL